MSTGWKKLANGRRLIHNVDKQTVDQELNFKNGAGNYISIACGNYSTSTTFK